jgi:hypothetical protein
MADYLQIAHSVLATWQAQGRPVSGALIQGSVAQHGHVTPGSDIDLCIVVRGIPDPAWFEERVYPPYTVETYPLAQAVLADTEAILTSSSLPFALRDGIIVFDPAGELNALRACIRRNVCAAGYRRARAHAEAGAAQEALDRARSALASGDIATTQSAISIALWHIAALGSALSCRAPTTRRAFVLLWQDVIAWGRSDLVAVIRRALGRRPLTAPAARQLADVAGLIKERYRTGVMAMLEQGEVEQAAWPLFCAAVWTSAWAKRQPGARRRILAALGYDSVEGTRDHLEAAAELAMAVHALVPAVLYGPDSKER